MPLRPKTKRRLIILAGIAALGASATAAVVTVRLHHHQYRLQLFRTAGMTAYQRHDYQHAADNLAKYLGNDEVDPEALLALAISVGNLPRADQSHLTSERQKLTRYLELNPADEDARRQLLGVDRRLGDWFDTEATAAQLLIRSPDDVEVLSAQLTALRAEGKLDAALAVAQHLDRLRPLDCRTEQITLDLMHRLGKPPEELTGLVDKLATDEGTPAVPGAGAMPGAGVGAGMGVAPGPGDPRIDLLRAVADSLTGTGPDPQKLLLAAAAKPSPDDDFTLLLADYLDANGLFAQATAVLAAADSHTDPALTFGTARRLFHAGEPDAALARLGPVTAETPSAQLGLRALVLATTGRPQDKAQVTALLNTLAARPDDAAAAWITLMSVVTANPPLNPRDQILRATQAGRLDPDSSQAWFYLGKAYRRLGETELATRSFDQARALDPSWAAAELAVADCLLDLDRCGDALPHARRAVDRDDSSADARTMLALIRYRLLPTIAGPADVTAVLNSIRDTRTDLPDDPRLAAAEVDLLARTGDLNGATSAALAAINSATATPSTLAGIAAVVAADGLDAGPEIAARAAALHPVDPQAAYDRAVAIADTGDPAAGRRALDADTGPGPAWQLVVLQYRDATGNPASPDAWAALADANPGDLLIQRAVLRSPAAAASRPLIDRTIDRLHALTGDEAMDWKLARARWQLATPGETREDADAVAASMAELVKAAPTEPQPLVIWAEALEKIGDTGAAIDRLKSAAKLEPDDPEITLRLARLMSRQGQQKQAGELLEHLARTGHLSPAAVIDAAGLLDRSGRCALAIELLDRSPRTAASELLRARLTAAVDPAAGDRIYAGFAKSADPRLIEAAARRLAARGDVTGGRALLAKTDGLLSPVESAIVGGNFESDFGTADNATADFTAAVAASPTAAGPWRAWAAAALRHRDWAAVADITARGLHQVPGDPSLTALSAAAGKFKSLNAGPDLSPLVDAVASSPTDPAAAATVAAAGSVPDLTGVVERNPTYWPARSALVHLLTAAGHYSDAADVAAVAVNQDPSDPAPAESVAAVWATAGRWQNARAAAVTWRQRTPADPERADLAIAVADIHLGRASDAVDLLQPYLVPAHQAVDSSPDTPSTQSVVIDTMCRALVAAGQTDRAGSLLENPAKKSAAWRRRWLRIIGDCASNPAAAGPQIDRVEALVPAGTPAEKLAVAETWYRLADRFNDPAAARQALDVLDPLTDTAHPAVDVFILLGAVQQQLGNLEAAETADRSALTISPNLPGVASNLAQVMLLRNEDPAAAESLARSAVNAEPASAASHETLGEALQRQNKFSEAAAQYTDAAVIDPDDVTALVGLAEVRRQTNQPDQAAVALRQARQAVDAGRPCPDALRARIEKLAEALNKPPSATVDVRGQ